ncbi:MAG: sigma-70 family RNA polymerase sigma factor [Clostridia bacterium]|jgi:RNA polymerase sigma-70 factor (ECF subfamily)|nr:sigma-70 family RNA polymerase sigma factor [Clostridia bacterium]
MEDRQIVDLYWQRSEEALRQTDVKYGRMLFSVSYDLTHSNQDSEECVNDTYYKAWNSMPTDRPDMLGVYLTKIVRALSVDRYRREHAEKRGGVGVATDELSELIPSDFSFDGYIDNEALKDVFNKFLGGLDRQKRVIFVKRYYFCLDIETISKQTGESVSAVKTALFRMRAQLGQELKRQGLL